MPVTFHLKIRNVAGKQERFMKMAVIFLLKVTKVTEREEQFFKMAVTFQVKKQERFAKSQPPSA